MRTTAVDDPLARPLLADLAREDGTWCGATGPRQREARELHRRTGFRPPPLTEEL